VRQEIFARFNYDLDPYFAHLKAVEEKGRMQAEKDDEIPLKSEVAIVAEVRKPREEIFADFDYDLHAYAAHLRALETEARRRGVRYSSRPLPSLALHSRMLHERGSAHREIPTCPIRTKRTRRSWPNSARSGATSRRSSTIISTLYWRICRWREDEWNRGVRYGKGLVVPFVSSEADQV
jgi:hypothetical protein